MSGFALTPIEPLSAEGGAGMEFLNTMNI